MYVQVWFVLINWALALACLFRGLFTSWPMNLMVGNLLLCGLHALLLDANRLPARNALVTTMSYGALYSLVSAFMIFQLMPMTAYDNAYFIKAVPVVRMGVLLEDSARSLCHVGLRLPGCRVPRSLFFLAPTWLSFLCHPSSVRAETGAVVHRPPPDRGALLLALHLPPLVVAAVLRGAAAARDQACESEEEEGQEEAGAQRELAGRGDRAGA